jgi:hypothetical protein
MLLLLLARGRRINISVRQNGPNEASKARRSPALRLPACAQSLTGSLNTCIGIATKHSTHITTIPPHTVITLRGCDAQHLPTISINRAISPKSLLARVSPTPSTEVAGSAGQATPAQAFSSTGA